MSQIVIDLVTYLSTYVRTYLLHRRKSSGEADRLLATAFTGAHHLSLI